MVNDPIADLLTRIRNAYLARHQTVTIPHSKIKHKLAEILKELRYIENVEHEQEKRLLKLALRYEAGLPAMSNVIRVSKPGLRRYTSAKAIPMVVGGMGSIILSTPQGLMTGKEARKKNLGGELICKIW